MFLEPNGHYFYFLKQALQRSLNSHIGKECDSQHALLARTHDIITFNEGNVLSERTKVGESLIIAMHESTAWRRKEERMHAGRHAGRVSDIR